MNEYILEPVNFVGAEPIRQDITILPAEERLDENGLPILRLGWVVYEELGDVAYIMGKLIKLSTGEELTREEEAEFWEGTYYKTHPNPPYSSR